MGKEYKLIVSHKAENFEKELNKIEGDKKVQYTPVNTRDGIIHCALVEYWGSPDY